MPRVINRLTLILSAITLAAGLGMLAADGQIALVITAAAGLAFVILLTRSWLLRTGRAFVHGYHAGYHDASRDPARQEASTKGPCAVLDLATRANERYRRLPA